jgi:hypothetical protein
VVVGGSEKHLLRQFRHGPLPARPGR